MKTFPLVYVTVPEELQKKLTGPVDFAFNPLIPLPVELPPEDETMTEVEAAAEGEVTAEKIKIEMILSGILLHLSENSGSTDSVNNNYYRNLIFAVKPEIADELHEAAIIKSRNGDYKTALEIFDLLFGLKGPQPRLLLNRALILEESEASAMPDAKNAGAAEAAFERALANPAPDTLFYAALFYEKQGNFAKASSCLESYLDSSCEEDERDEEDEKFIKARELLAEIRTNGLDDETFTEAVELIRKGSGQEGINKARDFLEQHPRAGRGWFVLGWGLRCLLRWEHAAECFRKALDRGCVNADTYNELAICLLEQGDLAQAEKELEKALALEPENVKIISNMGMLAVKRGDNEKASAFFRAVLELDSDDPVANSFLL